MNSRSEFSPWYSPPRWPAPPERGPERFFDTCESQELRYQKTWAPWFRVHDPVCAAFLRLGTDPRDFEAVKELFPFVRDAAVMQLPRGLASHTTWHALAFLAGLNYVRVRNNISNGRFFRGSRGMKAAEADLRPLRKDLGSSPVTFGTLRDWFWAHWKPTHKVQNPEADLQGLVSRILRAFRMGLMGGEGMGPLQRMGESIPDIAGMLEPTDIGLVGRVLVESPLGMHYPASEAAMAHPLLKLAIESMRPNMMERCWNIPFYQGRLIDCGIESENDCPASEDEGVIFWGAAAAKYGGRVKRKDPDRLQSVIKNMPPERMERFHRLRREILWRTDHDHTCDTIAAAYDNWLDGEGGERRPKWYGQQLERIVRVANFSIWCAWFRPD